MMYKKVLHLPLMGILVFIFAPLTLFAQDISLSFSMPEQATAGEKIPVELVIHKGPHSDFARFKQKIPPGFEVESVHSSNSDFTFRNGEVNFIWLKLPPQEKITLDYVLKPDVRLQGTFVFSGLFSYVSGGEREEVTLPDKSITILASPKAHTSAKDAIQGTVTGNQAVPGTGFSRLAIYRQQPEKVKDGNGWIIRILIKRGFVDKLARIEENIPQGYIAENIDGKGSIFSYRSGKLKYIWMKLPVDSLFVISYKLDRIEKTAPEPPLVTGVFSYMLNDHPATKKIITVTEPIPLYATEKKYADLLASMDKTTEEQKGIESAPSVTAAQPAATPVSVSKKPHGETSVKTSVSENVPGQPTEIVSHPAAVVQGIFFRVQILAIRHPVVIEKYMKAHHIPGKIYREMENGLYKYATGYFTSYKDARIFIQHLTETTDIDNAFVTAYDNGKRITVREALDRTGQKWFK